MEPIVLKFAAPRELDNLRETATVEKVAWGYGSEPNTELKLNLDNWIISCEVQGKSSHITKWKVNQDNHSMVLGQDDDGNFEQIDLAFAMSMLGQLVKREDLIRYLKQLEIEFAKMSPLPKNEDKPTELNKDSNNLNKE